MTASTQGKLGAYSAHQRGKEDVRETDARALLSCAARLKAAIESGGSDMKAYGDAIRHNQRLWTIFQIALCDPDNALPQHLKMNLLSLSRYIDRISFRAITAFTPQLLTEMIEINRAIAAGLVTKPKAEAPPPPPEVTQTAPQSPAVVVTTA